jgi:hypothetical protein
MIEPTRSSRRIVRALVSAGVAAVALAAAPRAARAYEHQYHLGGSFGYSGIVGSDGGSGLGGRIHFDYGITDAVNLMTRIEGISYPGKGAFIPSAAIGGGYVVDVLQWVPYIGAMAGVADIWVPKCDARTPCHQPKLDLEIPAGIDYLVTRSFAMGAVGRYQLLVLNGNAVNSFAGFLKAEYIWGF